SAFRSKPARRVLEFVGEPRVTTALHALRVVTAAAALLPGGSRGRRLALDSTLATTSVLLHPRHHYGTDGSDQVSFLVQSVAAVARSSRSPRVADAGLWAIGVQGTMSYAVSGYAKIAGRTWRQGQALEGVTRTMTYGDEWTWRLTRRFPAAAKAMGAGVLALECAAPLSYLGRGRLAQPYALGVTAMHLGIARTMALGRFVPAFLSMHPAQLYTARDRSTTAAEPGGERSDLVPRMLGVAAAGLAVGAVLKRREVRRTVLAGRGDERFLDVGAGDRLAYRRTGLVGAPGPVYLFENALLATPEHWEWIAGAVGRTAEVVTYHRVGYGPSVTATGPRSLQDLVDHAALLADRVAEGRPVVVVGHSLGGYLALLLAARRPDLVRAVVLVDSSHPEELVRSPRQQAGADSLTQTFPLICHSVELGCGQLLEVPEWVLTLPEAARRTALAQYRDARIWKAGRREWAATVADFGHPVPPLAVPVLGLSAERTVAQEKVQLELHEELVAAGSARSRHEIVPGSNHDTILTLRPPAEAVADRIVGFVAELGLAGAPTTEAIA
ncbi:MAG TPA: alpha/beta fold hydrolase, partial [Mycobacteriales bacterium]|nr:alpha/beta fold hydrolase [Mycobacteriales bacterium]